MFKESIESADDSILEDSSQSKAYYRKMQAYKEIQGEQYQVFVNINLLLKYGVNLDEKDRYDYQLQLKEWKGKWMEKVNKQ